MHRMEMEQCVPSVPPTLELRTTDGSAGLELAQAALQEPCPPTLVAVKSYRVMLPAGQVALTGHEQLVPLQQFGPHP